MKKIPALRAFFALTALVVVVLIGCGGGGSNGDNDNRTEDIPLTGVTLDNSIVTMPKGQTHQILVSVTPSNTTENDFIWSSSDESIATVSGAGLVSGQKCGTARITVVSKYKSSVSAFCDITVKSLVRLIYYTGENHTVQIAGEFNTWNPADFQYDGNGVWSYTALLDAGTYCYKLLIDNKWITDPENSNTLPDGYGGQNSVLTVK